MRGILLLCYTPEETEEDKKNKLTTESDISPENKLPFQGTKINIHAYTLKDSISESNEALMSLALISEPALSVPSCIITCASSSSWSSVFGTGSCVTGRYNGSPVPTSLNEGCFANLPTGRFQGGCCRSFASSLRHSKNSSSSESPF